MDEVWKEIVSGGDQRRDPATDHEITLEDFLSKSGAVCDDDLRVPVISEPVGGYAVDSTLNNNQLQIPSQQLEGPMVGGYASGIDGRIVGVGRGKRRAVVEEPVDKATQQKQRRMIKNRESAARSRERKQVSDFILYSNSYFICLLFLVFLRVITEFHNPPVFVSMHHLFCKRVSWSSWKLSFFCTFQRDLI